jgi:hypothetical protein
MDRFIKRYMIPKKDEYGNVVYDSDGDIVMVQSMISRKNPESEEARDEMKEQSAREFLVDQEKKRAAKADIERIEAEVKKRRKEREEFDAAAKVLGINDVEIVEDNYNKTGLSRGKKTFTKRPSNWREIGKTYIESGENMETTLRLYAAELGDKTDTAKYQAIKTYGKEHDKGYEPSYDKSNRFSVLGEEIEKELYDEFKYKREKGLPVSNIDIQDMVHIKIRQKSLDDLLNRGFKFRRSWVQRFCRRWKISDRVITTKMRESPNPDVLRVKDETYMNVMGRLISMFLLSHLSVIFRLIFGLDETSLQFYPRAKYSLNEQGAKRVRACGVGDMEKQQCTCTIIHNFEGEISDVQLIFAGKTKLVHPYGKKGDVIPDEVKGQLFSHTKSHWQEPDTYIECLEKLFIPFKNKILAELSLPLDTWVILVHDMHYSHLAQKVRDFLKDKHIAHVYIPAGCTDLRQICDVVINKFFKAEVRNEFRETIHKSCNDHINAGLDPKDWEPNLQFQHIRNQLPLWVNRAISKCRTQLRSSIKTSALKDALLEQILKPEFLDICKNLNANQPLPEYNFGDDDEEEELVEHDVPYDDEDDDVMVIEEEAAVARKMIEVQEGSGGAGGKLVINLRRKEETGNSKCCCGRDDQHHAVMAALKMDHICNICKGKCYGLCTESYTCFKCL